MAKFEIKGISRVELPSLMRKIEEVFNGEDSKEIFLGFQEEELLARWRRFMREKHSWRS